MVTMKKRYQAIKIVGFTMALLYITSLSLFALYTRIERFSMHAWGLVVLFGLLFLASLGIYRKSEMARKILVIGNFVLGGYLLVLLFRFPDIVSVAYVLGAFIFGG